ncbi:hypothetical protein ES692_01125 [Psychroserpens burtonensis]|uniref:DUF6268 domain-containing protein n=1 Tax=Psychroserpens burtonensis TaxID=49278 RepID=A0A5C7BIU1_9FLAO|nr:DUF6268 family outer membrane beta-barrel protein [Psychroserpens burtonensis]TXE19891.1 hypothetical protein ES692_01125 [Psychroserpens burtonensis]
MSNKSSKLFCVVVFCFLSQLANAQLTDLARLEYSFIPKSNSEDQYTRLRALLNYPIQTKEDCYLIIGAEYNRIILNLEDDYPFDKSRLKTINIIDLNFGYTFKTSEKWRLGFKFNPRIASTLTTKITSDDFFINGGAFAISDRTKDESSKRPYRLILGLTFNATTGVPFPLPFVSYFRRVNERWSFSAGVPKSNVKYFFTESSMLQTFIGLDGYFAHVQEPLAIQGRQVENISLSVAVGGLGYEYCFTKHLVAYMYAGYTFRLNNVLRDGNREEVFKLDDINAFYLRTGIKFKI